MELLESILDTLKNANEKLATMSAEAIL